MSPEQLAVEVSRWTRDALSTITERIASEQLGEAFDQPTTVPAFVFAEAVRLVALVLFAGTVLTWAAILG